MSRHTIRLGYRACERRSFAITNSCWYRLGVLALLVSLASPTTYLQAITISFDYTGSDSPPFDPDGSKLKAIVTAAGQIWGDYIEDNQHYSFDLRWEDIDGDTLGQHQPGWILDSRDLVFDTKDTNGNFREWFFDPTPFDNSEFAMQQTLVRDMNPQTADDVYAGSPPALLESAFSGNAISSAAIGKFDLLTTVLHEMGHMLGYNWNPFDGDYDFSSATVGGRSLAVNETDGMHAGFENSLMFGSMDDSVRKLPSATDILGTYDESIVAVPNGQGGYTYRSFQFFDVPRMDFLGDKSNSWHETLNWIGGAIPNVDNEVFIRHGGLVTQDTGSSTAKSVKVSEASTLYVRGSKLTVVGTTDLGNFSTEGNLNIGNLNGNVSTVQTHQLNINSGIANLYTETSLLNVEQDLTLWFNGKLMGAGNVLVGNRLNNNGQINGGTFLLFGFGGKLTLLTSGVGAKFDLDGSTEFGEINATLGDLSFFGPLADDFNGSAAIAAKRTMHFSRPWKMMGVLNMRGGNSASELATLSGSEVTIGGVVNLDGQTRITAPVKLIETAVVNLPDSNDLLVLSGTNTVEGGSFSGLGTVAIQGTTNLAMPNPIVAPFPDKNGGIAFLRARDDTGDGGVFDPFPTDPEIDPLPPLDPLPDLEPVYPAAVAPKFTFTTYGFGVPVQVRSGGTLNATVSSAYLPKQLTMSGGRVTGTGTVNLVGDLVVDQNSRIDPSRFLWGTDAANHRTTVRTGARLNLAPFQITRSAGEQVYKGDITLEQGATLSVEIVSTSQWTNAGKLVMQNASVLGDDVLNTGEVSGNGSFAVANFENAGKLSPGRILGGIKMLSTDFVQTTAGLMEMTLGNSFFGNGSSLLQTETAQLAGTLALRMAAGFSVLPGTEIDLITGNSIVGEFSEVVLQGQFGNSLVGEVLYRPNKVSFLVGQAFTSGDFNNDGLVDRSDMEFWKNNYDGESPVGKQPDGMDFLTWQRNFGNARSSGQLFLMAVPEPGTMLLGLVAIIGVISKRAHVA